MDIAHQPRRAAALAAIILAFALPLGGCQTAADILNGPAAPAREEFLAPGPAPAPSPGPSPVPAAEDPGSAGPLSRP